MLIRKNYQSTDDFPGLKCDDVSLAVQSEAEGCDINYILNRVQAGGLLPPPPGEAQYGDFSSYGDPADYINSLNAVSEAQEAFMALPAQIRSRFSNDPAKLLDFVSDKQNLDEARKLGLLRPVVENDQKNSSASPIDKKANPAPQGGQ